MTAVIVDMKDHLVKSPEEIVKSFYSIHTSASVKNTFWEIFICYAMSKKEGEPYPVPETEITQLFDDVTDLIEAVQTLQGKLAKQSES